jgi:hypothetical protein
MGVTDIKSTNVGTIVLLVMVILTGFTGIICADRNVPAMPEIQGLSTTTGMNVQGTITESDAGAWSINGNGVPLSGSDPILASYPGWDPNSLEFSSLETFRSSWDNWKSSDIYGSTLTLQDMLNYIIENNWYGDGANAANLLAWLENQGSSLTPPLESQEVQYTTGYNDQIMAVSGQSTFSKAMTVSTGNKIADQSNIKADTSLQYIAIDTGRATRTEDLLLDGAANAINTSSQILCPFASSVSPVIPAYCNIEQAGSSLDTSLTSVVTHADDRFVGTDSTFPVVLNYQINAQGITLSDGTSSPMIGSVSAYLKVHVQEARNVSTNVYTFPDDPPLTTTNPAVKSEDLVYSETSSATGLISHFSKSMSYQSGLNLI